MIAIFQSILLLFNARIAECCTQLPNNELVLVNKINETQSMNIQNLFIKQEQFMIYIMPNDSDIQVQQYMYNHSNSSNSFENIISVKCLRSYNDFTAANQYALLNKINDKYQIHTNSYQIEYNQRLPEFNQYFEITDHICHDLEILNRQTLIVDCYNESSNVFILQRESSQIQHLPYNQTKDFQIKRRIFAFQDDLIIRVLYYDEKYQYSSIQFIQFGETITTPLIIDDTYINNILNETETIIELQIVQVQVEQKIITILNKNQWVISIDTQFFPFIIIVDCFQLDLEYPAIYFAYHVNNYTYAFLTQYTIHVWSNGLTKFKRIDNKDEKFQIYFTKSNLIQYNDGQLNLMKFNLKIIEIFQIKDNYNLILDQLSEEIIAINEQESRRIIIRSHQYLYFKSNSLYSKFKSATLIQNISILESCTLSIKYRTIAWNSTEAIPTVMNQFNTILNSQIESYEVDRFIDGPNISISNINELKVNQVLFSINFEQLQQKTISGIKSEQTVLYIKVIPIALFYLYFVQLSNLYVQIYYCFQDLNCIYTSQIYLEFNLSSTHHEFFLNQDNVYIAVKNNQQLDVWKLSEALIYQCTIYPDQDHYIIQFHYINQFLAVLYSNQLVVIYKVIDQCQRSQAFTTEFLSNFNIQWNPSYIQTNDDYDILYVQTEMQLLLIQVKESEIFPINIIPLSYNKSVKIFSYKNIIWIYYTDTEVIESFIIQSLTLIEYLSTISLFNVIPNKYLHHQQSKYVYFQNSQDSLGTIYVYCMESSSHNALLTTFSTKYKTLYSVSNLFIIADINNYFEIPQKIKYSIYYQDIDNPNYLVKVNTFLVISSYDNKEQYKYVINSTLVNPYTTITVNLTQLNIEEFLHQARPIGYCQNKYSWYTGQVVDIGLRSQQLKLQKSMHLLEKEICSSGLDIQEYVSDSVLILHQDKLVKLNMTTKIQQIYYLDTSVTYSKIILVQGELVYISAFKQIPFFYYFIQIISCTQEFKCNKKYDDLSSSGDPKIVKVFSNLIVVISDIQITVYSFKDDEVSYVQSLDKTNFGNFQDVISPELNYFQVYSKKINQMTISMYRLQENEFSLMQQYQVDLLDVIQQTGFYIDPKTIFQKIIIKHSKTQQQLLTAELFCQAHKHSHYIVQIQYICKFSPISYNCSINNYKTLQIFQGYGNWPSNQFKMYKDQYILMIYYQSTTFISAIYSLELNYVHPTTSSTLFSGAIQYQNVSVSQQAFFTQESQIYLLTNSINSEVFALYEIHNTTKFCIQDHLKSEKIQITLKNNFHEKNETIDVNKNGDNDNNNTKKFIIWLVFGILLVFLFGMLLFGCYIKQKKRHVENQLIL
ncbi:unnamed protein product [Paramecium octaurelia]|uniref:Transmembrane protein n=1 Tax=Paramecium octaurelia TaxID=43137 RepID=A0A8S1UXD6_PAROT|nr:unnamed protein product [Paramecium octaurelia]